MKKKKIMMGIIISIISFSVSFLPIGIVMFISNKDKTVSNSYKPNQPETKPPIENKPFPPNDNENINPPTNNNGNNSGDPNSKPNVPDKDDPFNKIDDSYLEKNNLNIIDNPSLYSMATPGSGGTNSINVAFSPSKTTPSNGVVPNAISDSNFIRTDLDIKQSKRTFSLVFVDGSSATHLGTGWILDFKLTNDGSYPLTWYIASNSHVIQNLKVANDKVTPERYNIGDDFHNTQSLQMAVLNDFTKNKELETTSPFAHDGTFNHARIEPNNGKNLKTVLIGNDYLKTTPSMFSQSGKWQGIEEYIDFAVMEVTFENETIAKKMTHNYAIDSSLHFKYKKESLINKNDYINKTKFNTLGYPSLDSNGTSNRTAYLSTNKNQNRANIEKDNTIGSSNYYNTFKNTQGSFDAALALSYFGYEYRYADPKHEFPFLKQQYASWGLMYQINYGDMKPGSSGSMLMDENGYTWGIHLAGDSNASMGFSQALYCEGFNYMGKYGRYNLQGYDIIEGGFPNQQKSYKDGLKTLYGNDPSFKTNIFKNGLN